MCDYSLQNVASRPAKVGDKLTTHNFNITGGFAAVSDLNVAVCLMPGTELVFEDGAVYNHPLSRLLPRSRFGKVGAAMARFRQINMDKPYVHHDALEFANGKIVLVTRLRPGQRATVLQLPATLRPKTPETVDHEASARID